MPRLVEPHLAGEDAAMQLLEAGGVLGSKSLEAAAARRTRVRRGRRVSAARAATVIEQRVVEIEEDDPRQREAPASPSLYGQAGMVN